MSLFGDFFKKDVTAYPSGRDVATGKETRAKWSEEKKMSVLMAGCLSTMLVCAVGGTTLACMQENHMYDYDKSLLATIDSVAATGIPMENAVEKGVTLTNHRLGAGDNFWLKNHISQRLAEARDIADIKTNDSGDYDTVFVYISEFRDELAQKIAKVENRAKCQGHHGRGSNGGSFLNSAAGRAAMSTLIRGF